MVAQTEAAGFTVRRGECANPGAGSDPPPGLEYTLPARRRVLSHWWCNQGQAPGAVGGSKHAPADMASASPAQTPASECSADPLHSGRDLHADELERRPALAANRLRALLRPDLAAEVSAC